MTPPDHLMGQALQPRLTPRDPPAWRRDPNTQTGSRRKIMVATLFLLAISLLFWAGSRYPALNQKAAMGESLRLQDPLSFEAVLPIEAGDPLWQKVLQTTVNWAHTNQQGMTFGLLLGAAFLTLIPLLRTRYFQGHLSNSVLGMAIGAPLGVCVNCAAPIAAGMHEGGARIETTLAAMISSPTLNVIVLTMSFTLLPAHLVALKIAYTLLFLLVILPLMGRYVYGRMLTSAFSPPLPLTSVCEIEPAAATVPADTESWAGAVGWFLKGYTANLWFIIRITLPLMLLAGLMGALLVSVLPWEDVTSGIIALETWQKVLLLGFLALFGLFLPVPIAFDVAICAALYAAGVPAAYVMTLLFTLGIFSIYSFSIVATAISWRIAGVVAATLLGLGVAAGVSAKLVDQWVQQRNETLFYESIALAADMTDITLNNHQVFSVTPMESLQQHERHFQEYSKASTDSIRVERLQHVARVGEPRLFFEKVELDDGITAAGPFRPVIHQHILPFSEVAGISSGDINNDGWPDLLVNSNNGLHLYLNLAGRDLVSQPLTLPGFEKSMIFSSALVDLDNDGWLDLFFSAFRKGHFVVYNREGEFSADAMEQLPADTGDVARAVGFGDLDRDGRLEIGLGNYSVGEHHKPTQRSENRLLRYTDGGYRSEPIAGPPGATLSVLFSDINLDGGLDLLIGNDFAVADSLLMGSDSGKLRHLRQSDGNLPETGRNTMSIDSADIDNDLQMEIFLTQITGSTPADSARLSVVSHGDVCAEMSSLEWRHRCEQNVLIRDALMAQSPFACLDITDPVDRLDCIATDLYLQKVERKESDAEKWCGSFPQRWNEIDYLCSRRVEQLRATGSDGEDTSDYGAGDSAYNLLFYVTGDTVIDERAVDKGLDVTGWAWNARFADLDNDQWQDTFIVNGWSTKKLWESNILLHNDKGQGFEDMTSSSGLESFQSTPAYSYVDVDNDGDLDIALVPFDGPPVLYRNQSTKGNSITFELRDAIGNHFGIGSKLIITYGKDKSLRQIRELKASGGYLSFDAPLLHFGLGEFTSISALEIIWSTGERSLMKGKFDTGWTYRIYRGLKPHYAAAR